MRINQVLNTWTLYQRWIILILGYFMKRHASKARRSLKFRHTSSQYSHAFDSVADSRASNMREKITVHSLSLTNTTSVKSEFFWLDEKQGRWVMFCDSSTEVEDRADFQISIWVEWRTSFDESKHRNHFKLNPSSLFHTLTIYLRTALRTFHKQCLDENTFIVVVLFVQAKTFISLFMNGGQTHSPTMTCSYFHKLVAVEFGMEIETAFDVIFFTSIYSFPILRGWWFPFNTSRSWTVSLFPCLCLCQSQLKVPSCSGGGRSYRSVVGPVNLIQSMSFFKAQWNRS